jgi:hypothetical protein
MRGLLNTNWSSNLHSSRIPWFGCLAVTHLHKSCCKHNYHWTTNIMKLKSSDFTLDLTNQKLSPGSWWKGFEMDFSVFHGFSWVN